VCVFLGGGGKVETQRERKRWQRGKQVEFVEFLALECYQWLDCFRVLVGFFDFAAIVEFLEGDIS